MNNNIVPLNSDTHLEMCVSESQDYRRFAEQQLIPVVFHEFHQLATEFPLVFVKNSETGQFIPIAMMGVKNGLNLYCQTGEWPAMIKPRGFSNAPLSLVKTSKESDNVLICIDTESPLVTEAGENSQRLFDDNKEQSEYLKKRTQALLDIAAFNEQTDKICQLLASKSLFTAKQLTIKLAESQQPINIDGIYVIDEQALNQLSNEEFLSFKDNGLLPLIYAHLLSLQQIPRLIEKQNHYDLTR
ncbi:SapC family protein [Shewanella halifaxensis HAW-EB4]|uniref:SapC family protein n=1 Tax=Shewanella halifaxensis (strain HAW-EB4) TaxID=458817 RepID=B0TJC5_SHEHH|nr:SapC family protein [Shewanella halifaxensis]ABZ75716.1 SapC family protein [Shewanella halifaxensis HAW-EB4]